MNPQIVKLFGVVLVLYALLFGFTSYWSIFDSEGLEANVANKRPLLEEQRIKRGRILAADGTVIAKSNPRGSGGGKTFVRTYPEGDLFGNPIVDGADHCPPFTPQCVGTTRLARYPREQAPAIASPC